MGSNFGNVLSKVIVTINSVNCSVGLVNHTLLTVTIPASLSAVSGVVLVLVDGQSSNSNINLRYVSPSITSIAGCTSSGSATKDCSLIGDTVITLSGSNFGMNSALLRITVAGLNCSNIVVVTAHSALSCLLPVNPVGGFNVPVTLTYAAQSVTVNLLSFLGPSFKTASLNCSTGLLSTNPTTGSVLSLSSTASVTITIRGFYFASGMSVTYGTASNPSQFSATVNSVTIVAGNEYSIVLTLQNLAVGNNLIFSGFVGQQVILPSLDRVSYPIPSLTANSLARLGLTPATSVTGLSTNGDILEMQGTNFGADSSLLLVKYGTLVGGLTFICTNPTILVSNTKLSCRTGSGSGGLSFF